MNENEVAVFATNIVTNITKTKLRGRLETLKELAWKLDVSVRASGNFNELKNNIISIIKMIEAEAEIIDQNIDKVTIKEDDNEED